MANGGASLATTLLGSGVVAAIVSSGVTFWKANADIGQQNIELAMRVSEAHLKDHPEQVAIYAALMVDGGLIPKQLGCNIVGLALFTGQTTPQIFSGVLAALPPGLVANSFAASPCNLKDFGKETATTTPPIDVANAAACPSGQLYTQFGKEEQRPAGEGIRSALNPLLKAGSVTAPQIVTSFDATNPVVRYFFASQVENARRWQTLLESVFPNTDVKYAYVPGYEAAIGIDHQQTFELWWPASLTVPPLAKAHCTSSPDA